MGDEIKDTQGSSKTKGQTDLSALRIQRGLKVQVCRGVNFQDPCRIYQGNIDLMWGYFNDGVRSIRFVKANYHDDPETGKGFLDKPKIFDIPNSNQKPRFQPHHGTGDFTTDPNAPLLACFFKEKDFKGNSLCMEAGDTYSHLPINWRNNIESLKTSGRVLIEICKEFYFKDCELYIANKEDFPRGLRQNINSIRITSLERYACFFRDKNFKKLNYCAEPLKEIPDVSTIQDLKLQKSSALYIGEGVIQECPQEVPDCNIFPTDSEKENNSKGKKDPDFDDIFGTGKKPDEN